jgi:hypothetical protein
MTDPSGLLALQDLIRHLHGCESRHVKTMHVHQLAEATGETVWCGDVDVFDLIAHPTAKRAYAWSEATTGNCRRFFAVLHAPSVDSPAAAVRTSILADT